MADEAVYTAGYNIMSHLGKGKAIMGLHVTSIATTDTITTPFMRCVPVVSPGANGTGHEDNVFNIVEVDGVITFGIAGQTPADDFQVIILGDLY